MKPRINRLKALMMFVYEGKTCREIAAHFGVSGPTVASWSKEGGWFQRRREHERGSSQAALDVLQHQRELLIAEIGIENRAPAEVIDTLHKLTMSIDKMESRLEGIGPMLDVVGRFARFVAAHADRAECLVVRNWIEKFLSEERRKNR